MLDSDPDSINPDLQHWFLVEMPTHFMLYGTYSRCAIGQTFIFEKRKSFYIFVVTQIYGTGHTYWQNIQFIALIDLLGAGTILKAY